MVDVYDQSPVEKALPVLLLVHGSHFRLTESLRRRVLRLLVRNLIGHWREPKHERYFIWSTDPF